MREQRILLDLRWKECSPYRSDMAEKKNRPTPKRRDVEKMKSTPRLAPAATKEAKKLQKQQARVLRARQRDAYLRGEEGALPPRDRGPVRRFVRNYVDSRRTVGEFFLPVIILVLFMTVMPIMEIRIASIFLMYGVLIISVIDGLFIGRKVKREVKNRFPDAETKGIAMYAWLRSTQMRRLRAPLPHVKRGEKI